MSWRSPIWILFVIDFASWLHPKSLCLLPKIPQLRTGMIGQHILWILLLLFRNRLACPWVFSRRTKIVQSRSSATWRLLIPNNRIWVNKSVLKERCALTDIPTVRDPKYRTKGIELTDITTYAFAEFEDGSYGFWAAGKAGWFELKDPLTSFQHTFDMMNEAASMFYMLVDKSRRARKSRSNYTARYLDNYANLIFKDVGSNIDSSYKSSLSDPA